MQRTRGCLTTLTLYVETKQRTLEELDYVFAVSNRKFARYQLTKALPWWFNRWVLFRRSAVLEPLYTFDQPDRPTSAEAQPTDITGSDKKTESD